MNILSIQWFNLQVAYFGTPSKVYEFMVDSYKASHLSKSLDLDHKNPAGMMKGDLLYCN